MNMIYLIKQMDCYEPLKMVKYHKYEYIYNSDLQHIDLC